MKRLLILTLLLIVAAFSFSQGGTDASFRNLQVRYSTKLWGNTFIWDTTYFQSTNANLPFLPYADPLGWVLTTQKGTGKLVRLRISNLVDSLAPLLNSYWYLDSSDTIKAPYNVVVDSSLTFKQNLYMPVTTASVGQIKQGGRTVFHTYSNNLYVHNLFFGAYSGNYTMTGKLNTGLGANTLTGLTNGYDNVAVGREALTADTTGGYNTAIGGQTLWSNGLGNYNNALGFQALYKNKSGHNNTAIGAGALKENIIGLNNTALGHKAGFSSVGDSNIFIGYQSGYNETGSDKLYIENSSSATPLIYGDFAADSLVVNGDLTVTGQLKYDYKHLVIYTTGGSYNPNVTQNVDFKLKPGFSTTENDGLTFAGDSITVITPGDYFIQFAVSFQAANGDDWIFKCRKNGVAITTGNLALSTTGAGSYCSGTWFYYLLSLAAGDDICFTVTGENVGSDDPTFRSIKVFMEMKPE